MKNSDLVIAVNTVWVVIAAVLVMFMQAGFAFLEAGLTRMKNAAHIAGKNVLIFGVCTIVYWAVGFGLAFGNGNGLVGHERLLPVRPTSSSRSAPRRSRSSRRSPPLRATCSKSSSRVSRWRSSGAQWPSARSSGSTSSSAPSSRFSTRSSRTGSGTRAVGCSRLGMQDFAGSTVVHYQGALAALAGALLLGPRIGKFGQDGRANPIPGHNMPYAVLGTLILWFGWFGFNAGSTLGVVTGDKIGYFALRRADDERRRGGRSAGRDRRRVARPAQAGRVDDAERRDRRARRDHGRVAASSRPGRLS